MSLKSKDLIAQQRAAAREQMAQALKSNDEAGYIQALDAMIKNIGDGILADVEGNEHAADTQILAARGVRQLTVDEKKYYQTLTAAMKNNDKTAAKQALSDVNLIFPTTIIDSVFDDLRTEHPLLSKINFMPAKGLVKFLMRTGKGERAAWGTLTSEIAKEISSGFKTVDATLSKLSAFLPIAKSMLDLGAEYLDRFIRELLYEQFANGLEYGCVDGTGKDMPIGMTRDVSKGVAVTDGVYPSKKAIKISDFGVTTISNLLSLLAVDGNGDSRTVSDVVLIVNTFDYFNKVMPATTLLAPDATYRNNVLPYPIEIIQSNAMPKNRAIIGIASKYFAGLGMSKDGKIEYDDSYHFLEDERVYLVKGYANGMANDDNAFKLLDISDLEPLVWKVTQVTAPTASSDATLTNLKIGSLTLSPAFAAATTTYTAASTNKADTVTATPSEASSEIDITVNGKDIGNGGNATWTTGDNTVKVDVTAEDGTAKSYVVTVTKS